MIKENKNLCIYNMGKNPCLQEKGLCPLTSTSILCNKELLKDSSRLKHICSNGENEYYYMKRFKTAIMHVENDFCILVDYDVPITDEDRIVNIPQELCKNKYTLQRIQGRNCVIGNKNRRISYDIVEIIGGKEFIDELEENRITIDYKGTTYDETISNLDFTSENDKLNMTDKSHYKKMVITSMDELDGFLDCIIMKTMCKMARSFVQSMKG